LLERVFEEFRICRNQVVFGAQRATGPRDRIIAGREACDLGQKVVA